MGKVKQTTGQSLSSAGKSAKLKYFNQAQKAKAHIKEIKRR